MNDVTGEAVIVGPYRYQLTRRWADEGRRLVWIMLNPSTADADVDDPTIRRCIAFARRAGVASMVVVNLFALRATKPDELRVHVDPIGPENDEFIRRETTSADIVAAAWGNHGVLHNRGLIVRQRLADTHVQLHVLRVTKRNQPEHPLYVPTETELTVWKAA